MPAEGAGAESPTNQPGAAAQAEAAGTKPVTQGSQAPTAPDRAAGSSVSSGLLDKLGIEPELHEHILGKQAPPAKQEPASLGGEEEGETSGAQTEEGEHEDEGGDDGTPGADKGKSSPFEDPKVQKRMARFTRRLEEKDDELAQLRAELEKSKTVAEPAGDKPAAQPVGLENVRSERDLNKVVRDAQALLEWCDANAEGITTGEGESQKFIAPEEVAKWRRNAERALLNAPEKRVQLRDFTAQRQQVDAGTYAIVPELFDKESELHKSALEILKIEPAIANRADANLILAAYTLGRAELEKRAVALKAKNGAARNGDNGNGANHDDGNEHPEDIPAILSPEARRLRAQVPIAPVTPRAPSSGEPSGGRSKRFKDAMQNLAADPDGGTGSLSAALSALRSDETRTGAGERRSPVAP